MTIPTLISKYQRSHFQAGFKKSYSEIQHAARMLEAETGGDVYSLAVNEHGMAGLGGEIAKHLKKSQVSPNFINSVIKDRHNRTVTYKTFDGRNTIDSGFFDDGTIFLNDGRTLYFEGGFTYGTPAYVQYALIASYDVNGGEKGPNRYGYDLFSFILIPRQGFFPLGSPEAKPADYGLSYYGSGITDAGVQNLSNSCSSSSTYAYNGSGCAFRAMFESDYFSKLPS